MLLKSQCVEKDQDKIMQIVGIGELWNHGEIFVRQTKQKIGCVEWNAMCVVGNTYLFCADQNGLCIEGHTN